MYYLHTVQYILNYTILYIYIYIYIYTYIKRIKGIPVAQLIEQVLATPMSWACFLWGMHERIKCY